MGSKKKTLLLVEDETLIGLAESRTLAKEGYSVIHVLSGEEAVTVMNGEQGSSVDLILMDINLGEGIDGTEAAREILQRHDIPIVFLSSHTDASTVQKTEEITNFGYVVKNLGNTMLFATIKMALKLHQAYAEMREREQRFRNLIDKVQEGVCVMDEKDRFIFANPVAESIFGVGCGKLAGKSLIDFVDETSLAKAREERALRRSGKEGEVVQSLLCADGKRKTLKVNVIPEFGPRQLFKGSLVVFKEDTDPNSNEPAHNPGQKDILVRELEHRVKNSLNIIISLLSLDAQRLSDESSREILQMTEARIRSVALLYDFLSQSSGYDRIDSVEYFHDLVSLLKETYSGEYSKVHVCEDIEEFELDSKTCLPIGLIVNELFGNALKHAFPSGQVGTVSIELRRTAREMRLCVHDNGRGLRPGFDWKESQGLGLQLVRNLAKQLGGTMEVENEHGVSTTISIQLGEGKTAWGTRRKSNLSTEASV
jgi:PAS domain S-box-containing protein